MTSPIMSKERGHSSSSPHAQEIGKHGDCQRLLHPAAINARTPRKVGPYVANLRLFVIPLPATTSTKLSFVDATMRMQPSQRIVAETAHRQDFAGLSSRGIGVVDLDRRNAGIERQIIVRGPTIVDDLFGFGVRTGERGGNLPTTNALCSLMIAVQANLPP